jgi:2-polyprenyl-6-methoxyphenol hydroxylase-like FAD-dependent oxidoreductase
MIPPEHLDREEIAMFDAIVVGARCGGSPTAMLLARAGRRVLLVDRTTFPSDVLSGHAIQPAGGARLARWGLLDRVRATGTPFTPAVRFDAGPVVLEGVPTPTAGIADTICIRRTVIDTLLVDAAAEAGVEVRAGCTVKELLFTDGRVTGVRGRDSNGRPFTEKAAVVIGADGMHSLVARAVGAAAYHQVPAVSVNAYSYWSGLDVSAVELYVRPGRFIVAVPTNDDLVIINQGAAVADQAAYRADLEKEFRQTQQLAPGLAERVASGERVERFRFTTQTEGFFRVPAGPGWALVGDAGYHKDPITAQGMLDAFRDAEWLAGAVDRGLEGGPDGLDHALTGYQAARDRAALPMYELTCQLARLEPPDEVMARLLSALVGNPADTSRFLGIIAGSVPVTEFMNPANVDRLLGRLAA